MKNEIKFSSDHYRNIDDLKKQKKANKAGDFSLLFVAFFLFFVVGLIGILLIYKINDGKIRVPLINSPIVEENNNGVVKKFGDYAKLEEFMEGRTNAINYGYGEVNTFSGRMDSVSKSSGEVLTSGSVAVPSSVPVAEAGEDYSTTNIQVDGVDEGDIVKTDGKYIYTVVGNEVIIVDAYPASDAKELSRIKLDSSPNGIYISNNKLAVYGQNHKIYASNEYNGILPERRGSYTFLKIFDISDRTKPILKRSFDFEGSLVNSRMIGDYIYSVTSTYNYYYDEEFPVPAVIENGKVLSNDKSEANCYCPNVYYFDIPYHSYNFTTITSLNINDDLEKIGSEVYLLDGQQNNIFVSADNVYLDEQFVSVNNIYITFNKQVSEIELTIEVMQELLISKLDKKDQERISEIQAVKNYILSPEEKLGKIGLIFEKYGRSLTDEERENLEEEIEKAMEQKYSDISKELEKTVIHKIEIDGGELRYKTSGEVTGRVLNQFSMDENNGYFRIATTKNRSWSRFGNEDTRESYSNLYVLDGDMKVVGSVEGLAKGEKIYSVRFMQNRAYLVTFKQIDPLFVIDLTDPENPIVAGELKVPGYSSYLHPYDDVTLIGLGKETNDSGSIIGGIKLSLFDVSDISNPKEIDKYVLGDRSSNSIAINEHKAFLFSKEKNLLVIPVSMREETVLDIMEVEDDMEPREKMLPVKRKYFNGAAVFNINKKGFELKGKINHSEESDNIHRWGGVGAQRSLYIDDTLYTLSGNYLKANEIDDLQEVKSIKF